MSSVDQAINRWNTLVRHKEEREHYPHVFEVWETAEQLAYHLEQAGRSADDVLTGTSLVEYRAALGASRAHQGRVQSWKTVLEDHTQ